MAILRAELLKWKRSWVLWAALLAAAAAPAMNGLIFWSTKRLRAAAGQAIEIPWDGFLIQTASLAHLLVYPLLFGFVVTYTVAREFQVGAATNLFTLPARRSTLLLAKLGAAALILAVPVVAAVPMAVAAGTPVVGRLPSWTELASGLEVHLIAGLAQFLLTPVILWLAILTRGYVVPVATAGSFVVANVVLSMAPGDRFLWWPTALPAWTAQARWLQDLFVHLPAWWIELPPLFLGFLALAAVTVARRDVM